MWQPRMIVKNLFRNRRRTLLTLASAGVFFFLFTILIATYTFIASPSGGDPRAARLLIVTSRVSPRLIPVPLSYQDRIARLPGVDGVTPFVTFDAYYGGGDSFMVAFPSDPEVIFKIFANWELPVEQRRAYINEKVALVAGRALAQKHGWRIGDRVPLRSPGHNVTMDLVLRGIYTAQEGGEDVLAFHWDYFNDMRADKDKGAIFWVVAKTAEDVPRVIQGIDTMFRNSDVETMTQTMMQFSLDFMSGLGRVKVVLLSISGAVVFAVFLIISNTMAMSIRERTSELAVLRTLGFRTWQLLSLLTAESLVISLAGAAAGCLITWSLFTAISGYRLAGWIPISIPLSIQTVEVLASAAVGISLLSTLVPAYRASHVNIARALRSVG